MNQLIGTRFSIASYLSNRAIRRSGNQQAFRQLCREVNHAIERDHLREGEKFTQLKHDAIVGKKATKETIKRFILDYLRRHMLEDATFPGYYPDLVEGIFQQEYGFGPISHWFTLPSQQSAVINGRKILYQKEKSAGKEVMPFEYESLDQVYTLIRRLTMRSADSKVNELSPMEELMMENGTRVTIFVPPVTPHPLIRFRKYPFNDFRFEVEAAHRSIGKEAVEWFKLLASPLLNIAIVGPQRAGKTTLAKVWAAQRPKDMEFGVVEIKTDEARLEKDLIEQSSFISPFIFSGKEQLDDAIRKLMRSECFWFLFSEVRTFEIDLAVSVAEKGAPYILSFHSAESVNVPANLARHIVDGSPHRDYLSEFLRVSGTLHLIVRMEESITGLKVVESVDAVEMDEMTNRVTIYPWMRYDEEKGTWAYQFSPIPAKMERRMIKNMGRERYQRFVALFQRLAAEYPLVMNPMYPNLNAFTRKE